MIRFEIPDKSFIAFHQYPISMVGREILKEFLRMLSHLQNFLNGKIKNAMPLTTARLFRFSNNGLVLSLQ